MTPRPFRSFRLAGVLAAVMALAGCESRETGAPLVDSRIPQRLPEAAWPPPGWAWGVLRLADGTTARYGVSAAPGRVPRGQALILPGRGESAELWFETAGILAGRGMTVWMLDAGGRDAADQSAAIAAMAGVMRPEPVLALAQSTAAPSLLLAMARGFRVRGALLSAPVFDSGEAAGTADPARRAAPILTRLGAGRLSAPGQAAWARLDPRPEGRDGYAQAWQVANPDLRAPAASWAWVAGFDAAGARAAATRPEAPILMLSPAAGGATAAAFCAAAPRCRAVRIEEGRGGLHREEAAWPKWREGLEAFLDAADAAG